MASQEYNDFKSWYSRNYPFGFMPGAVPNESNYKGTREYQEWLNSNDYAMKYQVAGVSPETQSKADAYRAFLAAGGTHEQWLAQQTGQGAAEAGQPSLEDLNKQMAEQSLEDVNMQAWLSYRNKGGTLGYEDWKAQGYPTYPTPGLTASEKAQQGLSSAQLSWEKERFGREEAINPYEQAMLDYQNQQLAEQQRQFNQQQQYLQQQLQQQAQMQQQMIDWYRQQAEMEAEAERQRQLANLRANPASWLEYASLAGETPAVQPWMVPLSPKDYNLQAGQALPGWTASEESLSSLLELTTPSAQYLARISPSSRQQYGGYEQARTGSTPEDLSWLLGSKVAPPGGGSGLRWMR